MNNKHTINYSYWIIFLLIILHLVGCGNVTKNNAEVSLSLFGVTFQGESKDEVITNLIEQTDEFDYFDEGRTDIKQILFCGVPFGINLETEQREGITIITKITLITSHQSKAEFEAIKDGISKRLGKKTIESNSVRQSMSLMNYNGDRKTWTRNSMESVFGKKKVSNCVT